VAADPPCNDDTLGLTSNKYDCALVSSLSDLLQRGSLLGLSKSDLMMSNTEAIALIHTQNCVDKEVRALHSSFRQ
jgi:hypothetical protein